nr:hypothetical protein [Streptomyces sp. MJP52]
MPVAKNAEVTFTSADRVRDVIQDFNAEPVSTPTNSSWRNKHATGERLREAVGRANVV